MTIASYELLTGVGTLYIAPATEAMVALETAPSGNWVEVGETIDGVTVTYEEDVEELMVDQETGPVKVIRTGEHLRITTNLAKGTLENLAYALNGQTVTTTAPGAGTIGTKEVPNYRGTTVNQFSIIFRGNSPYGAAYTAQYYVPVGYFGGEVSLEHKKDAPAVIGVEFIAIVDPAASPANEKFGIYIAKNAAAI